MKNTVHIINTLNKFILLAIIAICLGIAGFAEAQHDSIPTLNVQTFKSLKDKAGKIILVDLRSVLECMDAKIPGALCMSCNDEKAISTISSLAKDSKIVFYAESKSVFSDCNLINRAAVHGFSSAYILDGGLPAWRKAGYPVVTEKRIVRVHSRAVNPGKFPAWLQQTKNPLVIDIRSAKTYATGHLDGALNFPLTKLHAQYADIPFDRTLLIVDEDGTQSFMAASYLAGKGFLNTARLKGGMANYRRGTK